MIAMLATTIDQALVRGLTALLSLYQRVLSPFLGRECRFYPTCSAYSKAALLQHGSVKGSLLTLGRICRCHPLCEGGVDVVPHDFSVRLLFTTTTTVNSHNGSQT